MQGPIIEKLTKRDADLCRALRAVVLKGKYEVQGEALTQVGALFSWLSILDKRIEKTLEAPLPETVRKELGVEEPKKKAK